MTWIKAILVSLMSIFAPIVPMIIATIVLIFIDLITGVWAALKRGEKIQSACLRRTITKTAVYQFAIVSGFIIETWLINGGLPLTKIVASIVAGVEGLSIYENLNTIHGSNIFKKILLLLGSTNDPKNN